MDLKNNLIEYIHRKKCTLLGVGPMSINCIDATIEIARTYNSKLMLIASRRQIDSKKFNGGYVNNWNTEQFSNYIKNKDKDKNILIARDHGGPWQNNIEQEKKLSLKEAMNSAKESFQNDIDSGFQVIHIDPSIDIIQRPSQEEILERLLELYEFCWSYSQKKNKKIIFEVGTEEQTGTSNDIDHLSDNIANIYKYCSVNKLPTPTFVVVQTGTKVMEMRNVGSFDSPLRVENEIPAEIQVPKVIDICQQNNILMKEHNADYLSNSSLSWHPRLGIHAANVAPEFGVCETKSLLALMASRNQKKIIDKFLEFSYQSKKWEKWILPNSNISDYDKSIIAGHYVFSKPEIVEIKNILSDDLLKVGLNLNELLKKDIKKSLYRYMYNFRLV